MPKRLILQTRNIDDSLTEFRLRVWEGTVQHIIFRHIRLERQNRKCIVQGLANWWNIWLLLLLVYYVIAQDSYKSYTCICNFLLDIFSWRGPSSVNQSCLTLGDPRDWSTPGLPVHHQLLEFTQTHVHRVSDVVQPSHPLSSLSPPTFSPSQHQSVF